MIITTVENLTPGITGTITAIAGDALLRRRLMEMGATPGSELRLIRWAPLGDPAECQIRGYKLSLRRSEAAMITVTVDETE